MKKLASIILLASVLASGLSRAAEAPAKFEGGVLVGAKGMTLYTFDKDAGGKSACDAGCVANWPPLMADSGAAPAGDFSVMSRDDGKKQWAYKGKPLYYWFKDRKAGDKTGDNVGKVWHMVTP